jgi:hypothetical protein
MILPFSHSTRSHHWYHGKGPRVPHVVHVGIVRTSDSAPSPTVEVLLYHGREAVRHNAERRMKTKDLKKDTRVASRGNGQLLRQEKMR